MAHVKVTTSDGPMLQEALSTSPNQRSMWQAAIDEELDLLNANNTWQPDLIPRSKPLPARVVLKNKRNADGSVERLKARIVAGENFQTYHRSGNFFLRQSTIYVSV